MPRILTGVPELSRLRSPSPLPFVFSVEQAWEKTTLS